ncbi:tyrosine--tRNA ligase [Candidatus Woesearchaeota archaeon]|nr:tyrosine--tRNA ligase [Candidatus Woesearchaeota archaeon]
MNVEERLNIIKQVGEEIVTEEELKSLLLSKKRFVAYDGFEPSGIVHIAQGVMRTININKMIKAGANFKMLVADWHAWANHKLGGNLENIQKTGEYLIEVWKACGMDISKVDFVWANELVKDEEYWKTVMKVAVNNTLKRIVRCSQIMGRSENETLKASQILYPCMQAADIFYLKADVCQLGMDQRKVNVLAREIGPKLRYWKPVIVSHHMLMGLIKPSEKTGAVERATEMKMSKSIPDSAIFMTDSEQQINEKINKAYCPEKIIEENPLMEYSKYLIFEKFKTMKIERKKEHGGDIIAKDYNELEEIYKKGLLHPVDLKNSVSFYINKTIEPVRKHFKINKKASKLLEEVKSFKITR